MKKHILLIIIGAFLLVIGVVLFSMKKNDQVIYYYETTLSRDEAISLITDKVRNIIDIYENKEEVFSINDVEKNVDNKETESGNSEETATKTEDNKTQDEYVLVKNYKEIVDNMYAKKGISELENIKFKGKNFVKKNEETNDVFLLRSIPSDNSYIDCAISVDNVDIKEDSIEANVVLSTSKVDKDNHLTYYVYEKKIKLTKQDDSWLVESFIYNNE